MNKIRIKNATDHEIYVSVQQEESSDFSFPSGSAAYYSIAPQQVEVWSRSQGNRPHYNYWVQDQGVTHKYFEVGKDHHCQFGLRETEA
jgi:hypothetical protein